MTSPALDTRTSDTFGASDSDRQPVWYTGPDNVEGIQPAIWIGFVPSRDAGEDPSFELRLIGTNRYHAGKVTVGTMMLPTSVEDVFADGRGNLWDRRLQAAVRNDDFLWPRLTSEQATTMRDFIVALRAFTLSRWDRIPKSMWPELYAQLRDGVPLGELMRAEAHLQRVVNWMRARYPRLYP